MVGLSSIAWAGPGTSDWQLDCHVVSFGRYDLLELESKLRSMAVVIVGQGG